MEFVQIELQKLIKVFLSKNLGGKERLAREFNVSRPTIERWANKQTFPYPVVAVSLVARLKEILEAGE